MAAATAAVVEGVMEAAAFIGEAVEAAEGAELLGEAVETAGELGADALDAVEPFSFEMRPLLGEAIDFAGYAFGSGVEAVVEASGDAMLSNTGMMAAEGIGFGLVPWFQYGAGTMAGAATEVIPAAADAVVAEAPGILAQIDYAIGRFIMTLPEGVQYGIGLVTQDIADIYGMAGVATMSDIAYSLLDLGIDSYYLYGEVMETELFEFLGQSVTVRKLVRAYGLIKSGKGAKNWYERRLVDLIHNQKQKNQKDIEDKMAEKRGRPVNPPPMSTPTPKRKKTSGGYSGGTSEPARSVHFHPDGTVTWTRGMYGTKYSSGPSTGGRTAYYKRPARTAYNKRGGTARKRSGMYKNQEPNYGFRKFTPKNNAYRKIR